MGKMGVLDLTISAYGTSYSVGYNPTSKELFGTMPSFIRVSVVGVVHAKIFIQNLHLPQPSTVKDALAVCCARENFPFKQIPEASVGVFGCTVKPTQILKDNDRIEIYRPLIKDANQARLERAHSTNKLRSK